MTRGFWHHASDLDHADWLNGPEAICEDRPLNLCPHGIDMDEAGCGVCLDRELTAQEAGEAAASAMQRAMRRIGGVR